MSRQVTVRLPEELSEALEARARRSRQKRSEIVRAALREHLERPERGGRRPADRVRRLIGALSSGQPDLAERHREYILEMVQSER